MIKASPVLLAFLLGTRVKSQGRSAFAVFCGLFSTKRLGGSQKLLKAPRSSHSSRSSQRFPEGLQERPKVPQRGQSRLPGRCPENAQARWPETQISLLPSFIPFRLPSLIHSFFLPPSPLLYFFLPSSLLSFIPSFIPSFLLCFIPSPPSGQVLSTGKPAVVS